jgi:hypothetical protein
MYKKGQGLQNHMQFPYKNWGACYNSTFHLFILLDTNNKTYSKRFIHLKSLLACA